MRKLRLRFDSDVFRKSGHTTAFVNLDIGNKITKRGKHFCWIFRGGLILIFLKSKFENTRFL